ncbi:zinc ribbon domain-containing protein [Lutibacter sp.]|uniref:zinc ribbon domain-containing protein n=1 Tax=Lutibacter sp. TaxID=1925666 RepID=UPI001A1B2549|nr:zinc ribbon domain-containing protein [Lutibacter sp.]MBI9040600.1 zinc-ribbon domain-containing protein [Lutibacter sp.]
MKYCSNCNTELKEETKFCTKCGISLIDNHTNNNDINLVEESLNQPNKGKRFSIALLVMVVLAILFFIGKFFMEDIVPSEQPFSIEEQLSKIEGEWHDPTGVILGNNDAIIEFNKKGDVVIGKDENNLFSAKITPFGANNYQAIVTLRGVEGDFELHFYEEENKLVFFSTLTKSSWYLKKNN